MYINLRKGFTQDNIFKCVIYMNLKKGFTPDNITKCVVYKLKKRLYSRQHYEVCFRLDKSQESSYNKCFKGHLL